MIVMFNFFICGSEGKGVKIQKRASNPQEKVRMVPMMAGV